MKNKIIFFIIIGEIYGVNRQNQKIAVSQSVFGTKSGTSPCNGLGKISVSPILFRQKNIFRMMISIQRDGIVGFQLARETFEKNLFVIRNVDISQLMQC